MSLPDMLSLIFLFTAAIYFVIGIMIISRNSSSTIHRVLFCSFVCLSWWAFAFTVANSIPSAENALLWRRLAAAGWGIYYSLFLHFVLILTEKKALLQKYWIYGPIYLPAVMNVFLYGIYDRTAIISYDLVLTTFGWANMAGITALDLVHFISYIGLSLTGIILLFHWGVTAPERANRKTALIVGCAALLPLIIGTLTEHLLSAVFRIDFPQVAPVVILFPALIMYFSIRQYGPMRQISDNALAADNQILGEATQARLFVYLALLSFIGSIVSFAVLFFFEKASLTVTLIICAVFMAAGSVIYLTARSNNLKADKKDTVAGATVAATLPVLTVLIYGYTQIHSWNLPLIFMSVAIIFNNKKIIILTGVAMLFSLIWSWTHSPVIPIIVSGTDHAVRMVIMAALFGFILYVNHLFKHVISENREKVNKEKFLSEIASLLMTVNESNIHTKIREVMHLLLKHLKADCADIFFLDNGQKTVKSAYLGFDTGMSASVLSAAEKTGIYRAALNLSRFWDGGDPSGVIVNEQEGDDTEKLWAEKIKAGTYVIIPLKNADQLIGIITIEKENGRMEWKEEERNVCQIVARLLADLWLRIETDRKIRHDASHDSLTGLPNRQSFTERLRQAINMAQRTGKLVGVFIIDIDAFKSINDSLGHATGDLLIRQIGQRIRKSVRAYDLVARFGGDEFLVMVPQADNIAGIEGVAAKVLKNMQEPVALGAQKFIITASIGVAVYPMDGNEHETLLKNADIAMYVSKEFGKNRYAFCSAAIRYNAHEKITLTNDLHWALGRNELFLHYQPQIETSTGEIIGAEALLRWMHPQRGMVEPSTFIPLAESSGQINSIGAWVISQACFQNKRWQEAGLKPIIMAVNLSPGQFMDASLVEIIRNALAESGLPPQYLELEITESIAVKDTQGIAQTMKRLKGLGVRLSIDDFGSGHSSLNRLLSMPVDKIKMDMRFVQGIGSGSKDEEIIKVILQLGKTFGIKVLAEGVDEERQLIFLRENFCEEIQGNYCFKPMSAVRMMEVLHHELVKPGAR